MKIYWKETSIPALQGLTPKERSVAKGKVLSLVWKHWQVWLPFVSQIIAFFALFVLLPPFPLKLPALILFAFSSARLVALPFHHYLDYYLTRDSELPLAEKDSVVHISHPQNTRKQLRDDVSKHLGIGAANLQEQTRFKVDLRIPSGTLDDLFNLLEDHYKVDLSSGKIETYGDLERTILGEGNRSVPG